MEGLALLQCLTGQRLPCLREESAGGAGPSQRSGLPGKAAAAQRGPGGAAACPAAEPSQSPAERQTDAGDAAAPEPAGKPGAMHKLRTRADSADEKEKEREKEKEKVRGPARRSSDGGDKPKAQPRSKSKDADERPAGSPKSKGGGGGGGAVLFEKVLTSSDAGGPGRVVIPKVRLPYGAELSCIHCFVSSVGG